ncbi:hypothetical protein GQ457_16G017970 [Hibiscus cannabinus]
MIKRYCWKLFVFFRFYARNDQPGRMKSKQYLEVEEDRIKVKVKDLKPSALKVTWSTSSAKRSPALLKGELREEPSFITSQYVLNLQPGED